MRDTLTVEEEFLLAKAASNPQKYLIEVDNDGVFVVDLELDQVVGDFYLYGQELIVALLKYIGANADFV